MSDNCSLEELTAFLDDSSMDEYSSDADHATQPNSDAVMSGVGEQEESAQTKQSACIVSGNAPSADRSEDRRPPVNQLPSKEDIQAELLAMQKRMEDLQKLLSQQNSTAIESANTQSSVQPCSVAQTPCPSFPLSGGCVVTSSPTSSNLTRLKPSTNLSPSSADKPGLASDNHTLKTKEKKKLNSSLKLLPDLFSVESTDQLKSTPATLSVQPKIPAASRVSGDNNKADTSTDKQLEKDLFGDSDSDWEDLEGAEKTSLSNQGKEIKKLIKSGTQPRISHVYSEQDDRPTWKCRPKTSSSQISPSTTSTKKNTNDSEDKFITDPLTGIRIVKPLISSTELQRKMQDRRLIRMSRLHLKVKTPDVQGNWVTIGVIVQKTDPKTSSTGKVYTIWKLSDLEDCDHVVSFFLFGQVYKEHWKTNLGSVVGLLNPSIMDSADKGSSGMAFTINNPHQLLLIGKSKDLGWCSGKTRKGNPCSNFISKKFGDFCSYHVQSAYRKASAKRSELQGSFTGAAPKSFEKKLAKTGGHFMYGGQTFLTSSVNSKKKAQNQVTVKKLQCQQLAIQSEKKVTTMTIHELKPTEPITLPNKAVGVQDDKFIELITTPTAGSMNLVKHLIKQEKTTKVQNEKVVIKSVTPKELLQQYQKELKEKTKNRQQQNKSSVSISPPSAPPELSAPVLGKGFYPGSDIILDCSPKAVLRPSNHKAEVSKRKAVAKVIANGGITKEDPNAVRKKVSPEKVKKRLRENTDDKSTSKSKSEEPPLKRSRLLGNVDLNSEEVKKLMKAKSSHRGALAEVEAEKEEKYFNELEKKEKMEEKMQSITELKTTVFTCKQCHYTAFSAGDLCKREHHNIVRHSAMKRFFKCSHCKTRTVAITKYPLRPCKKCDGSKFERTSMVKEKLGPKLECEILCLRGDEVKFLNSLQENVYL